MNSRQRSALHYLAGVAITAVFILPLIWTVVASLRQPGLPPPSTVEWWPQAAQWENYRAIFQVVPMARYVANSVIVVAVAVPVTLITASAAGFGISQLPWRPRRRLVVLSVMLLMIPGMAVWLFRFLVLRWLGLIDSLWALIIPAFAGSSPLFVLLFYWTFRRIPSELFQAARLDGASALAAWLLVAQPLAWPTTAVVAMLSFVLYWSDFVGPILYLYRPELYTLPVGLELIKQLDSTNWPLLMAAAVLMILPVLVVFAFLQRFLLHDLALGRLVDRD